MKCIEIAGFQPAGREYLVHLGNGAKHLFSSKREASRFIVETEKFLTEKLYALRAVNFDLYRIYYSYWGFMGKEKGLSWTDVGRTCGEWFQHSEDQFALWIWQSKRESDGNFRAFMWPEKIIRNCRNVRHNIQRIAKEKSFTVHIYELDDIESRLLAISDSIRDYSKSKAIEIVEPSTNMLRIA